MAQPDPKLPVIMQDDAPAVGAIVVSPSDTVLLSPNPCRALWVGGAGNLSLLMADGTSVIIVGVAQGSLLPFRVQRVNTTSTTATSIVALY